MKSSSKNSESRVPGWLIGLTYKRAIDFRRRQEAGKRKRGQTISLNQIQDKSVDSRVDSLSFEDELKEFDRLRGQLSLSKRERIISDVIRNKTMLEMGNRAIIDSLSTEDRLLFIGDLKVQSEEDVEKALFDRVTKSKASFLSKLRNGEKIFSGI